ncbi:MAG TPA: acyltransferase family protein [Candidatus Nanopelagicales bacterium]|nr:acyltransferase family protein [Candidatus Nanopelagicales bacterium]
MALTVFAPVPSRRAAAQTPEDRDRVVDLVRAVSLVVVVAGHSIMAVVAWPGGVPLLGNLLAAYPWTQALTWVLQIMPLFFFAGGAASAISWDRHRARGGEYPAWIWARADRLLRPAFVYLAVAGVIAAVVTAVAAPATSEPLMNLLTQLLWFLGVYLIVTALTPLFVPTTPLRAALVVVALLLACGTVDASRFFAGIPAVVGLLNFVIVWAVPAYLGSMRSHRVLDRVPRWVVGLVALVCVALNLVLIAHGPWPLSMVGMPGAEVSNMAPPTVVLALHSVVLVCVVTLLDGPLARLASVPSVWRPATWVNLVAMTLYLWHLPVLVAVTTLAHLLGLDRPVRLGADGWPVPDGWGYLLGSLLFWAVYAVGVWAVVRLMWPFEHAPLVWWDAAPRSRAPSTRTASSVAAIGCVGVGISTLVLSGTGLAGFPWRIVDYAGLPLSAAGAIVALLLSGLAIRWAGAPRSRM